ncbi:MAG: HD domain-containing phosphohydrolase [Candidatus Omnitrophota bacterium]
MGTFSRRLISSILLLVVFTSLSYFFFLFRISNEIFKVESIESLRHIIFVSGLAITTLAAIGAFSLSFLLTKRLRRPVQELVKATKALSRGDFDQHIKARSFTEIEELIFNFNYMVQQLKHLDQESKKYSKNLEKIARDRAKDLSYIYKISREVSSSLELDEVLDAVIKRTMEALSLRVCTILLVEEVSESGLKVARSQGMNIKRVESQAIKKGEGISGWVWEKREPLLIKDIDQDNRFIGREKEKYYSGSIIAVALEAKTKIIGVIVGNNKTGTETFEKNDLLLLQEIACESAIAIENALLYKSLKQIYVHTISALAGALDAKDHYTRSHSENVTRYAVAIAKEMGLSEVQTELIRQACQLHDLGKIGIHDYILSKKGKLSPEEWEEIRAHALRGAQILKPIEFLSEVAELIQQHHERYDGSGYPMKLSGQDIQLGARIMSVADSFDAMVSARPYRRAFSLSKAITELQGNSGSQFDPGIVKVFLKVLEDNPGLIPPAEQNKE